MAKGTHATCMERGCTRRATPGSRRCSVCGAYWRGRVRAKRDWERLYVQPTGTVCDRTEDEEIADREAIHARRGRSLVAFLRAGA